MSLKLSVLPGIIAEQYWAVGSGIFASIALVGAIFGTSQAVTAYKEKAARVQESSIVATSIQETPITKDDYELAKQQLQSITQGVTYQMEGVTKLKILIKDKEAYPEWLFAVNALPSTVNGAWWRAESLCISIGSQGCPGGGVASATLVGFRQNVKTNQ